MSKKWFLDKALDAEPSPLATVIAQVLKPESKATFADVKL
jgi:hypothetical protein